jgi:hypothetical protein
MGRKLGIVVMVVIALTLAACTSSLTVSPTSATKPLPAIDLSATPAGWVPVAYGDAQVLVPASFSVYYTGDNTCGPHLPTSSLFIGPSDMVSAPCDIARAKPNRTVVQVVPVNSVPSPYDKEKPVTINGFRAFPVPAGRGFDYYVPFLRVEASGSGPMARRVLGTLTHSPRAVVLAAGPAPAVPSDWKTLMFQGLAFAAPESWPVTRTSVNQWIGQPCATPGVALWYSGVLLSTDQQSYGYQCPAPWRPPGSQTPQEGIQVDAGTQTLGQLAEHGLHLVFSTRCIEFSGLRACPAISPTYSPGISPVYSILVLRVTVPGRSKPVFVSLGLAGNGVVARTILYSLKEA